MSPTIAECLEHARQCERYAARTNDEEDRKFLLRKAKHWTKLAAEKELEVRAAVRAACLRPSEQCKCHQQDAPYLHYSTAKPQ